MASALIQIGILESFFGRSAFEKFKEANGIEFMVRAHELVQEGYREHFGGQVYTVFSASKYFGQKNQAAIMLIDKELKPTFQTYNRDD